MKTRLMRLLRDNANAQARMPLKARAPGGKGAPKAETEASPNEATLYLYDVIVDDPYWGGVSAEDFVLALAEASVTADVIHLRMNCPGGDVFAARAMEAAVRGTSKKVIAHVDGYAASAASFLALACDEVQMAPGAFFMIHKAWTLAMGNADDLASTAALLAKIDDSLVATYAKETGQPAKDIAGMMAAETWLTAEEAVALGFADSIMEDAPKESAKATASWNLAAYDNAPRVIQQEEKTDDDLETAGEPELDPESTPDPDPDNPDNTDKTDKSEDVPHGEGEACTSTLNVGLNLTQENGNVLSGTLNRRLRARGITSE